MSVLEFAKLLQSYQRKYTFPFQRYILLFSPARNVKSPDYDIKNNAAIRIANFGSGTTAYKLVTPTSSNEWFDRMQLNAESFHRGMTLVLGERLIVSLSWGRQDRW